MFAKITNTGSYLPKKSLNNHDLAKFVDTSDKWITQRVGIESRHIADDKETTSFMALEAAKDALKNTDISSKDIGLIIVATGTSEYLMPSVASILQYKLSIPSCPSFDITAACSGFVYAIDIAKQYIENGVVENALVVASERMSRTLNWNDRSTCVLFGDGAGAVLLSKSMAPGIISSRLHSNGEGLEVLQLKSPLKKGFDQIHTENTYITMQGNKVFKQAVSSLTKLVNELLEDANITKRDIDWLVPHQANYRILEATAKKIGLRMSQVIVTLPTQGNTSAASIPLALDYAVKNNLITSGQTVLTEAFGAGFVWGGFITKF
jgi:3-oxoacyl-[acyl-carrier-protein] synthase-3